MNLLLRIGGHAIHHNKIGYNITLNKWGKITANVPAEEMKSDPTGKSIEILWNGNVLVSGMVLKSPVYFDRGYEIEAVDEFGMLTCVGAELDDGHFQHDDVADIMTTLLAGTGWVLDTTEMPSVDPITTIDLRPLDNRYQQISKAVTAYPELFVSQVWSAGVNTIRVGDFQNVTLNADLSNLQNFSITGAREIPVSKIRAYGDFSSEQNVTLKGWEFNPLITTSPYIDRFPVIDDGGNYPYVLNADATWDCENNQFFTLTKTRNNTKASASHQLQAQFALYMQCVKFLLEHVPYENVNFSVLLDEMPVLGDFGRVTFTDEIPRWHPLETAFYIDTVFSRDFRNRITKISTKFETKMSLEGVEQIAWDVSLSTRNMPELNDADEILARTVEGKALDRPSAHQPPTTFVVEVQHGSDDAGDCSSGTRKRFTVPNPSVPSNANRLELSIEVINGSIESIETNPAEPPDLISDDFVACLSNLAGTWGGGSPDTLLRVTWSFST